MGIPTLRKTWIVEGNFPMLMNNNIEYGTRLIMYEMKRFWTSAVGVDPAKKPTVVSSCGWKTDAFVIGGQDSGNPADQWDDGLVNVQHKFQAGWGDSKHSWVVLNFPGISPTAQICLDLVSQQNDAAFDTITLAPYGFNVNGTTSQRPTSSVLEYAIASGRFIWWGDIWSAKMHLWISNDGEAVRMVWCTHNSVQMFFLFEKPYSTIDPDMLAWIWLDQLSGIGTVITDDNLWRGANVNIHSNGNRYSAFLTCAGAAGVPIGELIQQPDDQTLEWPIMDTRLASTTPGFRGPNKGALNDLWYGCTARPLGETYPRPVPGPANQFAQFGHLIFPWDPALNEPLVA